MQVGGEYIFSWGICDIHKHSALRRSNINIGKNHVQTVFDTLIYGLVINHYRLNVGFIHNG